MREGGKTDTIYGKDLQDTLKNDGTKQADKSSVISKTAKHDFSRGDDNTKLAELSKNNENQASKKKGIRSVYHSRKSINDSSATQIMVTEPGDNKS